MNSTFASALRLTVLAAALITLPVRASAQAHAPADRAFQCLTLGGSVAVKNAGPDVEVGTFLVQVAAKLGQPTATLPDGTWLYRNYVVENSEARGTLAVRFDHGQVSSLALVTPAVATAMMSAGKSAASLLVAGRR